MKCVGQKEPTGNTKYCLEHELNKKTVRTENSLYKMQVVTHIVEYENLVWRTRDNRSQTNLVLDC